METNLKCQLTKPADGSTLSVTMRLVCAWYEAGFLASVVIVFWCSYTQILWRTPHTLGMEGSN